MGDVPENEQKWESLAREKGYKCRVCSVPIPFGERDIYFQRKLCGFCANTMDKDD